MEEKSVKRLYRFYFKALNLVAIQNSEALRKHITAFTTKLSAHASLYDKTEAKSLPYVNPEKTFELLALIQGLKNNIENTTDEELSYQISEFNPFQFSKFPEIQFVDQIMLKRRSELYPNKASPKWITGVWDFRIVPQTFGDYLNFVVILNMISDYYGNIPIKTIWFRDSRRPYRFDNELKEGLPNNDQLIHFSSLTRRKDQYIYIEDALELERYLAEKPEGEWVIPKFKSDSGVAYRNYTDYYRFIQGFHQETKILPRLIPENNHINAAKTYLSEHNIRNYFFATHIRNNKYTIKRNARSEDYQSLIRESLNRYPKIKWLIIDGERADFPADIAENCLFTREYKGHNVNLDYTLIYLATIFVGGPSGPSTMAYMNQNPCVLYNYRTVHERKYMEVGKANCWNNENQIYLWNPSTVDQLHESFFKIASRVIN
ncbi:MAG: hypothetical protein ACPGN3_12095 [Opitutales bacterium]